MSYAPLLFEAAPRSIDPINTKPAKSSRKLQNKTSPSRAKAQTKPSLDYPIIVHSHLRWDWVWQRPQQFLSRISRRHKILFVETLAPDPELSSPMARFKAAEQFPNITILRLQFPSWRWNDGAYVDQERRRLVQECVQGPLAGRFSNPVQWFYDPMAVPAFVGHMDEMLNVYDCMDELSKFACAPPQIVQRESDLLKSAAVVFTGGRKLYESKSRLHNNCHFYGCGVEDAHFGKARQQETAPAPELSSLAKPILGYFGVVDERLDYELIAKLAEANPAGSVVMVGPVIKVDEKTLPRRENLHWLGQRSYSELPALCKAFDVCLMPFALNEATEFINPTKALEYMATGRPIISTAVADVVRNFGSVVKIARTPEEFIAQCRETLEQPDPQAIARGLQMVAENSWDSIVERLENHIADALAASRIPERQGA